MAKLTQMGTRFSLLSWPERVAFMEDYRERRRVDLARASEFDLKKQAKSTKVREKKVKEPGEKKSRSKKGPTVTLTPEQLSLLKQLGVV